MPLDDFQGLTPEQVSETTGLYSPTQLKRMATAGQIPYHRGARGKVVFFRDDVRALLRQSAVKAKADMSATADTADIPEQSVTPFRTTPRSRAAHGERRAV